MKGYLQQEGVHYKKMYTAVVNTVTTCCLLVITIHRGWHTLVINFVGLYGCPQSARVIARVQEALDLQYGHYWWEEYVRVGKRLNSGLQHLGAEGPLYTTSLLGLV